MRTILFLQGKPPLSKTALRFPSTPFKTKHPLHNSLVNAHPKTARCVFSPSAHRAHIVIPHPTKTDTPLHPGGQRIRTIFEHLPELFRSLKIDLLEELLQHRRGPGQARRWWAARQARHGWRRAWCPRQPSSWDRPVPLAFSLSLCQVVGVFHLCASVFANVNVLGPVRSGGACRGTGGALGEPHRRWRWQTAGNDEVVSRRSHFPKLKAAPDRRKRRDGVCNVCVVGERDWVAAARRNVNSVLLARRGSAATERGAEDLPWAFVDNITHACASCRDCHCCQGAIFEWHPV